jgi:hypothetical protein
MIIRQEELRDVGSYTAVHSGSHIELIEFLMGNGTFRDLNLLASEDQSARALQGFFMGRGALPHVAFIAKGMDSTVYAYYFQSNDEFGLVKLYNVGRRKSSDAVKSDLQLYRDLTQCVINEREYINAEIRSVVEMDDVYNVEIRAVPVGDIVEHNGLVGVTYGPDGWILGDTFIGVDKLLRKAVAVNSASTEHVLRDVTTGKDGELITIPWLDTGSLRSFLNHELSDILRRIRGNRQGPSIEPSLLNTKGEIDRERMVFRFVLTDMAAFVT